MMESDFDEFCFVLFNRLVKSLSTKKLIHVLAGLTEFQELVTDSSM